MLTYVGLSSWPPCWHVLNFLLPVHLTYLPPVGVPQNPGYTDFGMANRGTLQRPKGMLPSLWGPSCGGCCSSSLGICDLFLPGPAVLWRAKQCVVFCSCIDELCHCFGLIAVALLLTNLYKVYQEESLWYFLLPNR